MSKFIKGILRHVKHEDEEFDFAAPEESSEKGTCLLVGGESTVGREFALLLAQKGHSIALAANKDSGNLDGLASELKEAGAEGAMVVRYSPSSEDTVKQAVASVVRKFGSLTLLAFTMEQETHCPFGQVNNITKLSQSLMDTNYLGNVYYTYHAIPCLRKSAGRVVALVSGACDDAPAKSALHAASSAAMVAFFETVQAEETGVSIVTVNARNSYPLKLDRDGAQVKCDPEDIGDPVDLAKILEAATH